MADRSGPKGLDRRNFLKSAGLVAAGGAAALPVVLAAAEEGGAPAATDPFRGPGAVPFALSVNGKKRDLRVEPRTSLLDALHHDLGVTGPKEVCDAGACGACTVLVDGVPSVSCMMLAIECEGREVTTTEGLVGPSGEPHPLHEAFHRVDALQCGFCTPGMVMSCSAVLAAHAEPTAEQVLDGIAGNLCRCGTYPRVVQACHEAGSVLAKRRNGKGK
jgi:aerobic-type carbon monoxide dehydrogenase small subunit (CoxS/CutS family)